MRLRRTPGLGILTVATLLVGNSFARTEKAPDIVFILADDMGYSDAACFGGELMTPQLDRLATSGVRMTRCFNAGMCVTSRTSFLTGRWWPSGSRRFKQDQLLSEQLKAGGYQTALIGKWHLPGHPMDHGFDHFFGFLGGFASHFDGAADYHLDRKPFKDFGKGYFSTDAFAERATRFIDRSVTKHPDQPFFLYLSFQAPHNPLQAPRAQIESHRGKYRSGWQAIREARFSRQKELGIVDEDAALPDYPDNLPKWEALTDAQRDLEDLRMATYAAMVEGIDSAVGKVVDRLKAHRRLDNTLLVFMSDNGADPFSSADPAMLAHGKLPGDRGSNYQPGFGWAYACGTPWRLYKISQHAGGVTTGGIFHWPAEMKEKGLIRHDAVHFVDLMPTFLNAAGFPSEARAGESFLPVLKGDPWKRRAPMFFQYMDNRAVRNDHWTLVEVDGAGWELYDTRTDPLETTNLAEAQPKVVQQLSSRWSDWWKRETGKAYVPKSTATGPHYTPQGDRGTGRRYQPSSMPARK